MKMWLNIVGKPDQEQLTPAFLAANVPQNASIDYSQLEAVILQGLIQKGSLQALTAMYDYSIEQPFSCIFLLCSGFCSYSYVAVVPVALLMPNSELEQLDVPIDSSLTRKDSWENVPTITNMIVRNASVVSYLTIPLKLYWFMLKINEFLFFYRPLTLILVLRWIILIFLMVVTR
jgi:hypothetical protein